MLIPLSPDLHEGAPLGERLYAELRRSILDCRLRPGADIYENELATRYAVSKSPVRDALMRLRVDGLVDVAPRRGYRVKPVSVADVAEMYAMRLIYERAAITELLRLSGAAVFAELDRFSTSDHAADLSAWIAENREFHSTLARLSGNMRLYGATCRLLEESDRIMHLGLTVKPYPEPTPRFGQAHAEIIEAIQRREKRRALALISGHIEGSRDRALKALRAEAVVV